MYVNMMTGKMLMKAFNTSMAGTLQGMGMLGNPALMNMQTLPMRFRAHRRAVAETLRRGEGSKKK